MKYEWRKEEKDLYLPGKKPITVDVPEFSFFMIEGKGTAQPFPNENRKPYSAGALSLKYG